MERLADGTACVCTGPEDAQTVILVHGLGLNLECWQWTVPALLESGFRTVSYDLYGHGQSAAPPETPSLSVFSRQLKGVLEHFGLSKAAIVGFSLGGMIARRFAQDFPEHTAGIAILNSPYLRSPEAQAAVSARVELARQEGPGSTVENALERWFTPVFRAKNPDMMDLVRGWVISNDKVIYPAVYKVLADGLPEITKPVRPIACPALVLTGDEDFGNNPEMSAAIAGEIDGAELHVLKGLRHMALAERPAAVNDPLTAFLRHIVFLEEAVQ